MAAGKIDAEFQTKIESSKQGSFALPFKNELELKF
jgi:hypothetical protein